MQKKTSGKEYADGGRSGFLKKTYQKPVLKTYGLVKHLTQSGGTLNGEAGANMRVPVSDRRLKENIVRIDAHPLGFSLYLFDYKPEYREQCGYGRQFGVMADEVETVMPEAVSIHPDGYMMVNYALLGIDHTV